MVTHTALRALRCGCWVWRAADPTFNLLEAARITLLCHSTPQTAFSQVGDPPGLLGGTAPPHGAGKPTARVKDGLSSPALIPHGCACQITADKCF